MAKIRSWAQCNCHMLKLKLVELVVVTPCRGAAPGGGDPKRQKPAKGVAIAVGPLLSRIPRRFPTAKVSSSTKVTVEFTLPP